MHPRGWSHASARGGREPGLCAGTEVAADGVGVVRAAGCGGRGRSRPSVPVWARDVRDRRRRGARREDLPGVCGRRSDPCNRVPVGAAFSAGRRPCGGLAPRDARRLPGVPPCAMGRGGGVRIGQCARGGRGACPPLREAVLRVGGGARDGPALGIPRNHARRQHGCANGVRAGGRRGIRERTGLCRVHAVPFDGAPRHAARCAPGPVPGGCGSLRGVCAPGQPGLAGFPRRPACPRPARIVGQRFRQPGPRSQPLPGSRRKGIAPGLVQSRARIRVRTRSSPRLVPRQEILRQGTPSFARCVSPRAAGPFPTSA